MNATQKGLKLVIEVPMQTAKLSATGKTLIVATTRGPWESPVEIEGKPVKIILNAYIEVDEPAEEIEEVPEDLDPTPKTKSRRRGRR